MQQKRLFERAHAGGMDVKNRFVRSAVWMRWADDEGHLTQGLCDFYRRLVDGGVGSILTGYTYIEPSGKANIRQAGFYDDSFIDEWKVLTDYAHSHDTRMVLQVAYGGSQSGMDKDYPYTVFGPSAVRNPKTGVTPVEMTVEDIKGRERVFAQAAQRARRAGFDGIEVHAAHGYLLSQFLTPYFNHRTDDYGGPIHNRARFLYETLQAMRQAVGPDFPIWLKTNLFDATENPADGMTFDEAKEVLKHIDEMKVVDIIEPSASNESLATVTGIHKHVRKPETQSYFRSYLKELSTIISTPLILLGGNRSMDIMEEVMNDVPNIQLASLGRPLLSEPDLINKWAENRDYRPRCVSCNHCWDTEPNSCILNRKQLNVRVLGK